MPRKTTTNSTPTSSTNNQSTKTPSLNTQAHKEKILNNHNPQSSPRRRSSGWSSTEPNLSTRSNHEPSTRTRYSRSHMTRTTSTSRIIRSRRFYSRRPSDKKRWSWRGSRISIIVRSRISSAATCHHYTSHSWTLTQPTSSKSRKFS